MCGQMTNSHKPTLRGLSVRSRVLQLHPQVLPEVQPELSEKRRQPAGHAALPGGGVAAPLGGGEPARRL